MCVGGILGQGKRRDLGKTKGEGEDPAAVRGPHKGIRNLSCIQEKGVGGEKGRE